ncbi:four helix bundle protein [bacterium]|nr:MAG: four helix bundle protein [bacterium]
MYGDHRDSLPDDPWVVEEARAGYRPIEELDVYADASRLADDIFLLSADWPFFARDVVGKQLARAADSVAANMVEGDGRLSVTDGLRFLDYARASARETEHFLRRAQARNLLDEEQAESLIARTQSVSRRITKIIQYRRTQL